MTRTAAIALCAVLAGCAYSPVGEGVDFAYGRAVEAIEADVRRVQQVHDDALRLGELLVCGGSGPAPLRAYDDDEVRAWGCYCAAVEPQTFGAACPAPEPEPTVRREPLRATVLPALRPR